MKRALLVGFFVAFGVSSVMAGGHSCCQGTATAASDCKVAKEAQGCPEHATKADMDACMKHMGKLSKVDSKAGNCPVSGEPARMKVSYSVDGTTYHFCCKDCVKDFKANPAKYTSKSKS